MTVTAYGLEQLHNGPDPEASCTDWTTIVLRNALGADLGSIAATVTNDGESLVFYGEWTNGATPVTIAEVALSDGVEDCKADAVDQAVLANQKVEVTVTLTIQNAA